jgi:hypothetical protein
LGLGVSSIGGHDYGKATRESIGTADKRGKTMNIRFKMEVDVTGREGS